MPRGNVTVVTEMPLGSDAGMGWGFSIGERFTITFAYRTEREARLNREKAVELFRGADVSERWQKPR